MSVMAKTQLLVSHVENDIIGQFYNYVDPENVVTNYFRYSYDHSDLILHVLHRYDEKDQSIFSLQFHI